MRACLIVLALLAVGCNHNSPIAPTPTPAPPSLSPTSIQLAASTRADHQTDVIATVYTAERNRVPNIPIVFTTAAGTITAQAATTDGNGTAVAVISSPTTTTVSATIGGSVSASIEVTGASAPSPITPTPPTNPFPEQPPIGTRLVLNAPPFGTTGVAVPFGVSAAAGGAWTWTFGDGATLSTTAYTTAHTYAAAGNYTITVAGGPLTASSVIAVTDPAPIPPPPPPALTAALICTPVAHGSPTPCNVSATYGGVLLPSATITNVAWDWGDGTTTATAGPSSTQSYVNAGTYTVFATVTATTIDGPKTATTSKSIVVP